MSIIESLLSVRFLSALVVYGFLISIALPVVDRVYDRLEHPVLEWKWDHIFIPLMHAAMLAVFFLLAYPAIYGVSDIPSLGYLFSQDDLRINYLVNLLFIVSLFFPLLPVIGTWHELVLPLQGIAASMLIFSWIVEILEPASYSFWPGWETAVACLVIALTGHWIATMVATHIGHRLDAALNVLDSGELLARAFILLVQTPVIVIYGHGLGRQL